MKAIQKSILVLTLVLVYGLGCATLLAGGWSHEGNSSNTQAGHYITSPSSDIGFHLPQPGPTVSNHTHLPVLSIKESKYIVGALPFFDAEIEQAFKQLEHFSVELLLCLRLSELLFPAHFFW